MQTESTTQRKRYGGYEFDYTGDLSRLLRVPGTLNHKGESVPVKIIHHDDSCRYSLDERQRVLKKTGFGGSESINRIMEGEI